MGLTKSDLVLALWSGTKFLSLNCIKFLKKHKGCSKKPMTKVIRGEKTFHKKVEPLVLLDNYT